MNGPDGGMQPPVVDAPPAPPRCRFTFADLCNFTAAPPLTYSQNTTLNTTMANTCGHIIMPGNDRPELCVIYAESITINANVNVRAVGTRPLMFASSKGISIAGTLSASSLRANGNNSEVLGAGAESVDCDDGDSPESAAAGGGGGAGGSFSGKGGNGSIGAFFNGQSDGGESPDALALADVDFIRGGCRGQIGGDDGDNTNDQAPGAGGPPGGGLYLAASSDITIAGRVAANGGGGRGGGFRAAGGGGGSGGMIILEARSVNRSGMLVANGGGGGEGGGTIPLGGGPSGGLSGNDGEMSGEAARGGDSIVIGGAGGSGSDASQRNGRRGEDSGEGGSGGGGAAGFIRMITTGTNTGTGTISPPVSQ